MTYPLSVTDPGMQAVLTAFEDADTTTKAVRASVTAAQAGLQWSGDASTTYKNSLEGWLGGLSKVEAGMAKMRDAMQAHQKGTTATEEDARGSSNWYR